MNLEALKKLRAKGIKFRVIEHEPVVSIEDVERVLKIPRGLMVKTLVFRDGDKPRFFVAALPADRRLSWRKFSRVAGVKRDCLHLVEEGQLKELTGFDLGGIPPFGYGRHFLVILDRDLLSNSMVFCSAGLPTVSLEIQSQSLLRLSGGKSAIICKERGKV